MKPLRHGWMIALLISSSARVLAILTLFARVSLGIYMEIIRWGKKRQGAQIHRNFDNVQLVPGDVTVDFGL